MMPGQGSCGASAVGSSGAVLDPRRAHPRRTPRKRTNVTSTTSSTTPGRTRPLWLVATVVTGVTAAAIWGYAVPREAACFAIYPAPYPCSQEHRVETGVLWTVVLAITYAVALAVTLTVGRRRRPLGAAAVVVLVLCAVVAYAAVLFSTGYLL